MHTLPESVSKMKNKLDLRWHSKDTKAKDVDQGESAYPVGTRPWVLAPRKEVLMGGGREGGVKEGGMREGVEKGKNLKTVSNSRLLKHWFLLSLKLNVPIWLCPGQWRISISLQEGTWHIFCLPFCTLPPQSTDMMLKDQEGIFNPVDVKNHSLWLVYIYLRAKSIWVSPEDALLDLTCGLQPSLTWDRNISSPSKGQLHLPGFRDQRLDTFQGEMAFDETYLLSILTFSPWYIQQNLNLIDKLYKMDVWFDYKCP